MSGTTLDIENIINPDAMAREIAAEWHGWNALRVNKMSEWKELRNFLYATSTATTSNNKLPWTNSTTTPKLTQIMDNLHANYFATLFPQQKWMRWEAATRESNERQKVVSIQGYMENKVKQSGFVTTAASLLYDWIQYGNCFGLVDHTTKTITKSDGSYILGYNGPKLLRISPYDIVFNPTAPSFEESAKIIRAVMTLGELKRKSADHPHFAEIFDKMLANRASAKASSENMAKADGFIADGFGSLLEYYESNYVEVLTFYGDIYDEESNKLLVDRIITVVDRAYVISNEENESWLGQSPIFHAGWRERPDNLYAMGPLDNLVGMQYRIDHLENLKADVFDQIAYPMLKIRGDVEDFEFAPSSRIYLGDEGDVGYLVPETTALQADFQIRELEAKMEEMAGAPKQAMGIRTQGEKTAFEVQSLQNAASRIFEHKTAHFERVFLEPVLNAMLEVGRRKLSSDEEISLVDSEVGTTFFRTIQKSDIVGNGRIVPVGARHFAERARRVQTLTQLAMIKASDPSVAPHLSGKELARILSEELGEPKLFSENIAVTEQLETQQAAQAAQVSNQDMLVRAQELGI